MSHNLLLIFPRTFSQLRKPKSDRPQVARHRHPLTTSYSKVKVYGTGGVTERRTINRIIGGTWSSTRMHNCTFWPLHTMRHDVIITAVKQNARIRIGPVLLIYPFPAIAYHSQPLIIYHLRIYHYQHPYMLFSAEAFSLSPSTIFNGILLIIEAFTVSFVFQRSPTTTYVYARGWKSLRVFGN